MTDETLLSLSDAEDIGFAVVEMADRARVMDMACPGAEAKRGFKLDDVAYEVIVRVARKPSKPEGNAP